MNTIDAFYKYENIIKSLDENGAFLTVKSREGKLNSMTIGWALLGIMWRKPILMVAVRPSRYTFELIENADDFTVTFPYSDVSKQLTFFGTHSGRSMDKFKESGLTTLASKNVKSPIIDIKDSRSYECKIVQKTAMDKDRLDLQYNQMVYQDNIYHTYFFGEVVACYEM
ncbi:MAG: flavin reductase [Gammaproteobacteria bacterium]|nr:flavin reductase [Gammaproteobacteria bacterium]